MRHVGYAKMELPILAVSFRGCGVINILSIVLTENEMDGVRLP